MRNQQTKTNLNNGKNIMHMQIQNMSKTRRGKNRMSRRRGTCGWIESMRKDLKEKRYTEREKKYIPTEKERF